MSIKSFHQQVVINDEKTAKKLKEILSKEVFVGNSTEFRVNPISPKELYKKWNSK